jgi:hypothetical protein
MIENQLGRKYFQIFLTTFWILIVIVQNNFSQLNFYFENNGLNSWQQSDSGHWEISGANPIDGKYSLHQSFDNPQAGNDQISIAYKKKPNEYDTIQWSFRVKHGYNPSSSNNWATFLLADENAALMFPGSNISALVVGVNFTGSDDFLKIWKIDDGVSTITLQSNLNWESSIGDSSALVVVQRFPNYNWILKVSANGDSSKLKTVGSGIISYFPQPDYFGFYYKYSSSQDRKFWADDVQIKANFIDDTISPIVDSLYFINDKIIKVEFSETVEATSVVPKDFFLEKSSNSIDTIKIADNKSVELYLKNSAKVDSTIWIDFSGIIDLAGNKMQPITFGLNYFETQPYDVLISEIMANPVPTVGLPPFEYIELYNRSAHPVNIDNWKLLINSSIETLPGKIILPDEYLILCSDSAINAFKKYGSAVASWHDPFILNNTGTSLKLEDSTGRVISFVNYSDNWYNDVYKNSGGWSLEMIDANNPCGGSVNWSPSNDKSGGTPGRMNSIAGNKPDDINTELFHVFIPTNDSIILQFSEPLGFTSIDDTTYFSIDNEIGRPLKLYLTGNDFSSIALKLKKKLENGITYRLQIKNNICDCSGNQLTNDIYVPLELPVIPDSFDLVINEVLYNPFPYGSRFVEIYNRSGKVIDAGSLLIENIDIIGGSVVSFTSVADNGLLLFPGNYLAVTDNIANQQKFYTLKDKTSIIESDGFPTFPDKKGIVALETKSGIRIDEFEYSNNMQFGLLSSSEGVSLERLNANWPTQSSSNWHSASQVAGFATPGYENSETDEDTKVSNEIIVKPEIFSPNNDGLDDVVNIILNPEITNCNCTISIFNSSGLCVRHLISSTYLSSSATLTWDGLDDDHMLQQQGIYIVHVVLTSSSGAIKDFKKACVLGMR